MKQIRFDARFKEAILNKEMVATIRNSIKVKVGDTFIIDTNYEDTFIINFGVKVKARCVGVVRLDSDFFTEILRNNPYVINFGYFFNNLGIQIMHTKALGFKNNEEVSNFYKPYLKNEHCYLHIFELLEG